MSKLSTKCPKCSYQYSLDEGLYAEIEERLSHQNEENLNEKLNEIASLKKLLDTSQEKAQREAANLVAAKLKTQKEELESRFDKIRKQENELAEELKKDLEKAQITELKLRQDAERVKRKEKELDLELERRLEQRLEAEKSEIAKTVTDEFSRKDRERESVIAELRKQLIEMKRKTEQGSQQLQGEVLERDFEVLLTEAFKTDLIEEVPKGISGADIVQTVISPNGTRLGKVIWELKQTKSYSPKWVDKLKADMLAQQANVAILVSNVRPTEALIQYESGVWIISPIVAIDTARVIRQGIVEVSSAVASTQSTGEKAEVLYAYLTHHTFRQRLEAIVECFRNMREDLDKEKRALTKCWRQRESQIEKVLNNTVNIYSDIQSVVGRKVLTISSLELAEEG